MFKNLGQHFNTVYKYVKRSYFDLEYMMNNILVKGKGKKDLKDSKNKKEESIDSS